MPGGEKRNQNRDSIKCGKRKAGKVAARFSVICTKNSSYDRFAFIWFAFWCVPKNSLSPISNSERHARDEYSVYGGFFSIKTKPFIINIQMHKMKAFVLISYSFIDVRTV